MRSPVYTYQPSKHLPQWLVCCFLVWWLGQAGQPAAAQSEEMVWAPPINLSQSGAADELVVAVAAQDAFHLIWQDAYAGFVYVQGDGTTWQAPQLALFPFSEPAFARPDPASDEDDFLFYTPLLVTDENQLLHGFWGDGDGRIMYSQVPVADLMMPDAWLAPQTLAPSAIVMDAAVGANGRLHLTYIRPLNAEGVPPGVYHRYSDDAGLTWVETNLLYQSNYFRSISEAQANLKIVTGEDANVYIVWDDPAFDAILLTRSQDGGETWTLPIQVDQRRAEDNVIAPSPAGIDVIAHGEEIHLTWRAAHDNMNCAQYHQRSLDGGATWEPPQPIVDDAVVCPQGQLLVTETDLVLLASAISDTTFLQVWNGEAWSEPAAQQPLPHFSDPQTHRQVTYTCLHLITGEADRLLAMGCGLSDSAELSTRDIWLQTRSLGTLEEWFARDDGASAWQAPVPVAESLFQLLSPHLTADQNGRIHAVWSQSQASVSQSRIQRPVNDIGNVIYYARLEGGQWSSPRPILSTAGETADQPAMAADGQGNLFVVWRGGQSGSIYFSRARADRAAAASEWQQPLLLSALRPLAQAPDILVGDDGTLYVSYVIPLNEDRGVYFTSSDDDGHTWAEPIPVFDGTAAAWPVVGAPKLALTHNKLHVQWTRHASLSQINGLSLVYARSEDKGQTWSSPEVVAEGEIMHHDLVGIGVQTLHQTWLEMEEGRVSMWYRQSLDNGVTWSSPIRVTDASAQNGPAALVVDVTHQPHIIQLVENSGEQLILQELSWNNERWRVQEQVLLDDPVTDVRTLAASITVNEGLGVVYTAAAIDVENEQVQSTLFYTSRPWDGPLITPTPPPTSTPIPPTPSPTPLLLPTPTATLALAITSEAGGGRQFEFLPNDPTGGLIISVVPAALIVFVVFLFGLRIVRNR